MAKKEEEEQEHELDVPLSKKKRKKKKGPLIVFIVILLVGIGVFMNKGIINRQLAKWTKDIPVVNDFFKVEEDPNMNFSKEELSNKIKEFEGQVKGLNEEIEKGKSEQKLLLQKIESLEVYEGRYEEFVNQKNKWDEEIAKTNPQLFI